MTEEGSSKLCVTNREAAQLLSCSLRTIEKMVAEGSLHSVKLGRSRRIRMSDLVRFVDEGGTD
jgi:excisionase family DNA binding protein